MKQQRILIAFLLVALFLAQSGRPKPVAVRAASPQLRDAVVSIERYANLAVGVPGEDLGSATDAGHANIIYGSAGGLSATGSQGWSQEIAGIVGGPEAGDEFGRALAAGDFDGDGYTDLAVGVPGEHIGATADAGHVNIIYGSAGGLSATGSQGWSQGSAGIVGGPEAGDEFGRALTAGDFNGDGYTDLAVGVPGEDLGSATDAGHVNIIYGSAGGLSATGSQGWSQEIAGIVGGPEAGDLFGFALAAFPTNISRFVYLPLVIREP